MKRDYWSWMEENDLPALQVEAEFTAARYKELSEGERRALAQKLAGKDAEGLAFYRRFERAALLYRRHEGQETTAPEGRGTVYVKDRVKAVYGQLLAKGFRIPPEVSKLAVQLGLDVPAVDLATLPALSTLWSFRFALQSEYISKDDAGLYAIDNPVRKEQLLKRPMVAASTWKGALRAAYRQVHGVGDDAADVARLFGEVREDEGGAAGALHCFASYFTQLGLAVINPHDRSTGIGVHGPSLIETVPRGDEAIFSLLLLPAPGAGLAQAAAQTAADIERVSEAVHGMFRIYGFGAKTSSGSGVAKEKLISGRLEVAAGLAIAAAPVRDPARADYGTFTALCAAARAAAAALRAEEWA